jgi:hypothetical protein
MMPPEFEEVFRERKAVEERRKELIARAFVRLGLIKPSQSPNQVCFSLAERLLNLPIEDAELAARLAPYFPAHNVSAERRELWKKVAVSASRHWIDPHQPAMVADAVLAAFDAKFPGCEPKNPETRPPEPEPSSGPIDAIIRLYGG